MISINTGPPGNGKSKSEQADTIEELVFGYRDIVTSTPVRILPWATADGRGMIGLQHYLKMRFHRQLDVSEFGEPVVLQPDVTSWGRLLVVEDENELATLFLWRRDRLTGDWFKIRWDDSAEQFNKEDLLRGGGACLVITDEAWKCYSSRRWKDTAKATEFYGRQHRKFGDDWHIISHSHKDIDVQLNRMAHKWQVCTNFGMRRMGIFKQPSVFQIKTYYEPPSGTSARCFHTTICRLDPLLVQTYDTSAGVAVSGGRAADVTRRSKGIHWGWLLFGIVLFFGVLSFSPFLLGKISKVMLHKIAAPVSVTQFTGLKYSADSRKEMVSQGGGVVSSSNSVGTREPKKQILSPVPNLNQTNQSDEVKITGSSFGNKQLVLTLSDGRTIEAPDALLEFYDGKKLIYDGQTYFWARLAPASREAGRTGDRSSLFPGREVNPSSINLTPAVSVRPYVDSRRITVVSEGLDRGKDDQLHPAPPRVIGSAIRNSESQIIRGDRTIEQSIQQINSDYINP